MKINYKSIAKWTVILILDISVYLILGVLLMTYEDFYDESKGEYWSLGSMTTFQKIVYILYNFWIFLNCFFVIKILWTGWQKFKNAKKNV